MFMFQVTNSIQSHLSRAQAVPGTGLLVSPIKAMISTAQLVAGFVATVIFTVLSAFTHQPGSALAEYAMATKLIAISGLENLEYSFSNFLSCGRVGRRREQLLELINSTFAGVLEASEGFPPFPDRMHERQAIPFDPYSPPFV